MSRVGIPLCAWCGKSLAYAPNRVTVTMKGLPGHPTVGWHMGTCERHDRPIAAEVTIGLLRVILARGIDRVVSLKRETYTPQYRWRPGLTSRGEDAVRAIESRNSTEGVL